MSVRFAAAVLVLASSACIVGEDAESEGSAAANTWGPYDPKPGHPTVAERDGFIAEVGVYAQEAERLYGTPAAAITAMAANESGFGWTRIALEANNLFGWKWYSSAAAGGRPAWTLENQPASDPGNQYVVFADRRDAVLFVASKLAQSARYQPTTAQYQAAIAAGTDVRPAVDSWIYGIAYAGYNPYEHYPVTTIKFTNNYRTPTTTFSPQFNLYRLSPQAAGVWVSVDAPAANAVVSGDVAIVASAGGGPVTSVRFATRALGTADWYALGEATTAPFTRTWSTRGWVPDGTYELRVEALDGATLRATGIVRLAVDNP